MFLRSTKSESIGKAADRPFSNYRRIRQRLETRRGQPGAIHQARREEGRDPSNDEQRGRPRLQAGTIRVCFIPRNV